jgi:hypothetical protein
MFVGFVQPRIDLLLENRLRPKVKPLPSDHAIFRGLISATEEFHQAWECSSTCIAAMTYFRHASPTSDVVCLVLKPHILLDHEQSSKYLNPHIICLWH